MCSSIYSPSQKKFIDVHCHLQDPVFENDLHDVIEKAQSTGVKALIIATENVQDFTDVLRICDQYPKMCYPCLGVHPVQDGNKSVTIQHLQDARQHILLHLPQIIGIGEVGLDFTPWLCHSEDDKETQRFVLQEQVKIAVKHGLPLNVHSRSAAKETVKLLKASGATQAVLHNFAGRPSVAMEAAQQGYYMSFPPEIVRKPDKTRLLKQVPLDRLLLETDSPYLGPVAENRNEPANITLACDHIAEIKGIDSKTLAKIVWENSMKAFPKLCKMLCDHD